MVHFFFLTMVIGLTACDLRGLTENQAETDPHHSDRSLRTRNYHLPYDIFFNRLLNLIDTLPRWRIVHRDRLSGEILAERQTKTFRFVDDIRIQVSKIDENRITLNLRSASRVGQGDFGQNARNIREVLNGLDDVMSRFLGKDLLDFEEEMALPDRLSSHVERLAGQIGERHFARPEAFKRAAHYIHDQFENSGYEAVFEHFHIKDIPLITRLSVDRENQATLEAFDYKNVVAVKAGLGDEVIVLGAHYDTAVGTPGADDNASGIAVLLEVARLLQQAMLERSILFVAFANEEPPFFRTKAMGSAQFINTREPQNQEIALMISLEMLGYYSEALDVQGYPPLLRFFYPAHANFLAVVGNFASNRFVKEITQVFRKQTNIAVESLSAPSFVPGVDYSDHRNFWKAGIPAVMLTDTAFYRNPNYHGDQDLPQTLNYEKMGEVTKGVFFSLLRLGKVVGANRS
ncbi:M28 family peptidase [Nitrospira defluvii]|nr:M28 family peptidase [Nitrospira defluvii]